MKRKKGLDLLLVTPPNGSFMYRASPLGVSYIRSVLEDKFKVGLRDYASLSYTTEEAAKEINSIKPKILGIYSTSLELKRAYELIERIDSDETKTLLGGPHATGSDEVEKLPKVDHVFKGESEASILDAVRDILEGPGKKVYEGEPVQDLDTLPFPSYESLPLERYFLPQSKDRPVYLETSRGCPFDCKFCSINKKNIRYKSTEKVVAEMERLANEFSVGFVEFADCIFGANKERVFELCDFLCQKELDLSWGAQMRIDTASVGLLKSMSDAGCSQISFGIESGDYTTRKYLGKGFEKAQIINVFDACHKLGIETGALFILGIPGFEKKSIAKTKELAKRLNPKYCNFSPLFFFPSTYFFDAAVEEGQIPNDIWERWATGDAKYRKKLINVPNGFSYTEWDKLLYKIHKDYYYRLGYIKNIFKGPNKLRFLDYLKYFKKTFLY